MNLAWALYRWAAPGIGALAPWARLLASPVERELWDERLGTVASDGDCDAWVHAASLGEAVAVGPLVRELRALEPEARLFLTAATRTGRSRLKALQPTASLAPLDSPQAARRFFGRVRPRRLFLVETEIWPHWMLRAREEGVPVAIVSARLSERSLSRYRWLGPELRSLVAGLAGVLCQTEEDRARWLALGARPERTGVVGNLKHDALPERPPDKHVARARCGLDRGRPVLVLGSLRPGEAAIVAAAWRSLPLELRRDWQVVAVPRHARVAAELKAEAADADAANGGEPAGIPWRWDERPGVLMGYYEAADVAFVGGSLLAYGGHNPMEPAACGCAVVIGSHHRSQAQSVRALQAGDAVDVVRDAAELAAGLRVLLGDPSRRAARAAAAQVVLSEARGGAHRAVGQLAAWGVWPAA